jgi:hypothetical protein
MSTLAIVSQLRPPKPKWTQADMPNLSDKVAVVTGGNGGVGKEIIKVSSDPSDSWFISSPSIGSP